MRSRPGILAGAAKGVNNPRLRADLAEDVIPLGGATVKGLLGEIAAAPVRWDFRLFAPTLASRPVLLVSADDGNEPGAKALEDRLRAAGDRDVTGIHMATDHPYSDHRIALSSPRWWRGCSHDRNYLQNHQSPDAVDHHLVVKTGDRAATSAFEPCRHETVNETGHACADQAKSETPAHRQVSYRSRPRRAGCLRKYRSNIAVSCGVALSRGLES